MRRPAVLAPTPAAVSTLTGSLVATLLLTAIIFSAPAFALPFIDIPRLIGGVFTSSAAVAFWLGYWLFFAAGVFVFGPLLALAWEALPGYPIGFGGALAKGVVFGGALWVLMGLVLPVLGSLNRAGIGNPGLFALGEGIAGAAVLLAGHIAYGLTAALVSAMPQGIKPLDTLGWMNHHEGDTRDIALEHTRQAGRDFALNQ